MKNYNIINKSIDIGLRAEPIGNGGYIKILEAPTSADILIHLNDSNADGIPLKAYHSIEAKDIDNVYISCNAVPNATLKIAQSKTALDFKIVTPVSDIAVDEIGGYSPTALALLDKVINPYGLPTFSGVEYSNGVSATVLNKVLTSDKILFTPYFPYPNNASIHNIYIYLDGVKAGSYIMYYSGASYSAPLNQLIFENVRGKTLTIDMKTQDGYTIAISMQEFALKP